MRSYNIRKMEVLRYVHNWGSVTSSDLAGGLNLEIHNAGMLLLKYHRQGLLNRRSDHRSKYGRKIYTISEKGMDRLEWLSGSEKGLGVDRVSKDTQTGPIGWDIQSQAQGQILGFISLQEAQRMTRERDWDDEMKRLKEQVTKLTETLDELSKRGEWLQQEGNYTIIEEHGPDGRIVTRRWVPESHLQFENMLRIIKLVKKRNVLTTE